MQTEWDFFHPANFPNSSNQLQVPTVTHFTMKKIMSILAVLILSAAVHAQSPSQLFSGWKLKSLGISMGIEQDKILNFGGNSFMRMSGYEDLFSSRGLDPSDLSVYSGLCENPHLRLQAIFQPSAFPKLEFHTALVAMINRVDGISYFSDEYLDDYYDYFTVDSWGSEVAGELALIRRFSAGPFSIYGGLGTNLGFHFANEMNIYASQSYTAETLSFSETGIARFEFESEQAEAEYLEDYRPLSAGISQRVFAQLGGSITLKKRLELGMEGRYGYGYRLHFNEKALGTNLHSFAIFGRWNLK